MLTERLFFEGWIAAQAHRDQKFVDTRHDRHHRAFARVVASLQALIEAGDPVASDLLVAFVPSPFTQRYRELDSALVEHQRGLVSAMNPLYPGVELRMTSEQAIAILATYSPEERALFDRLASDFLDDAEVADERARSDRETEERAALR